MKYNYPNVKNPTNSVKINRSLKEKIFYNSTYFYN